MEHLLVVKDLKDGTVDVSWRRGNAIPRSAGAPLAFVNPLTNEDRTDLQWYLEEYLRFPYGAERDRAARVQERMKGWGEGLFRQLFRQGDAGTGPPIFYQEAAREGLRNCELCVTSDDATFLGIPWEFIYDPTPGSGGFLAQQLGGTYRQWTGQAIKVPPSLPSDGAFRILLVIARPFGETDVPLGTVSRPLLEALRPLRPRVELEVLRPPTFDELTRRLSDHPGRYHLVHFDGHGVFAGAGTGPPHMYAARAGRGHLVFETDDGEEHVVNSEDLGQALADCRVPLFVLNACQSAVEGENDPFSSVASQLVAVGARGVVAMNHSVYATTAASFMRRFYERLIDGVSLSESVAAGRKTLFANPRRPSVIGPLELHDWVVPALYQSETEFVPIPTASVEPAEEAEEKEAETVLRKRAEEACPEGRFGFIGRDYDILRIERALRNPNQPAVLISGIGGIGKTELAYGFARWYAETGGCPGGVFATDFKQKADFGQVIGSIVGFGTEFSRLPDEKQWEILTAYVRDNACLLVWDNFETVNGYPEGSEPLAAEEEREKFRRFVRAMRGGKSRILITSRKPNEDWLGVACERIEIGGLNLGDAALMAEGVLRTVGRRPDGFKDDPNYGRLVDVLKGHPRSLEIVLPHLEKKTPAELIEALQHRVDGFGESLEDASLAAAFSLLSARAQKHLSFLGLFTTFVHAGTLEQFVAAGDERQRVYEELLGETLTAGEWESILEEAARNGFVRSYGQRMYGLHPTLPTFLRRKLVESIAEEGVARLDAEFMKFYAGWAAAFFDQVRKADANAIVAVHFEEGNLLRAVRLSQKDEEWGRAQTIVQTLCMFYEARERSDEWRVLRHELLRWTGREMESTAEKDRARLWMFLLGEEADDARGRNDLDPAEVMYKRILAYLESLRDPEVEPKVGVAYHQLGMITQERQRLDEAEGFYRNALEIYERLGLQRDAADDYHQLGRIAQERQRLDEAEGWYRKALEVRERLGLEREAADEYHQLGRIAPRSGNGSTRRRRGIGRHWRSVSVWGWNAGPLTTTTSWESWRSSGSGWTRRRGGIGRRWRSMSGWGTGRLRCIRLLR